MNMKLALFMFICFIISFIFSCSSATSGTIDWWCARIPYNHTCNHYVVKDNPSNGPLSINQFLDMTVLASIDEARAVLKQTREIESKYPNIPGKSLWRSCVDYFDGIVYTLNMILNHTRNPTPLDVQTWISGGLTYISTCKEGFELISMTNTGLHTISTNLTELLLNSLNISAVIRGGNNTNGIVDWNFIHEYNLSDQLAEDKPDVVVAQDGSGDFTKIQEAINSWWDRRQEGKRFVIYVKAGVYEEYVMIKKEEWDITIFGDGINQTIITGDKYLGGNVINTIKAGDLKETSTFQVWGYGFIARDITFRNTAGAELEQAVAFLSGSDESAFYHCSFEGYQDTLYTFIHKQFFKECQIYGTVDFIFGNSLAVFQDCEIFFRIPRAHGGLVATAQGKEYDDEGNGYSFQWCKIMAGEDLKPIIDKHPKAYLGRPWKREAVTVFMQSFLDDLVDPKGWLESNGSSTNAYYGEYKNYGPGSSTHHRVNWTSYHVIKNVKIAKRFTIENYINGNDWLPKTGVPFTPGISKRM